MPYAAVLVPDTESINKICTISKLLYADNFSNYLFQTTLEPHITLGIFNNINPDEIKDKLNFFCKSITKIKLILSQIGIFPTEETVIFLAPVMTKELFNIHVLFNQIFSDFKLSMDKYYLPDNWVPHFTLGMNINDLATAIETVKNNFFAFQVTIEKLRLIEFLPGELKVFNLIDLEI
ncbi:MAG: 2'-5' RNA ligase family protein [Bacteroidota bacterium]|nr:2'-5' RNA ligase family protein [Bacteroidota bacterium]